jgi:hypothetical protein
MKYRRVTAWGTEWARSGHGVGMEWARSGHGVGMEWAWSGHGVGTEWAWSGHGVGMQWVWDRRDRYRKLESEHFKGRRHVGSRGEIKKYKKLFFEFSHSVVFYYLYN